MFKNSKLEEDPFCSPDLTADPLCQLSLVTASVLLTALRLAGLRADSVNTVLRRFVEIRTFLAISPQNMWRIN
ncbi:hypothetical protein, partial [Escherichia coli]|uniref:hypothetical protein n=1 Tax=Escherichia coli TaxID=562 RepID=UPI00289DFB9C